MPAAVHPHTAARAKGDQAMTMHTGPAAGKSDQQDRPGPETGTAMHHRMPVGGWIREIATSENWRSTTIVRRHRDSAATPGLI